MGGVDKAIEGHKERLDKADKSTQVLPTVQLDKMILILNEIARNVGVVQ